MPPEAIPWRPPRRPHRPCHRSLHQLRAPPGTPLPQPVARAAARVRECVSPRTDRPFEILTRLTATKVRADLPPAQQAPIPRRDALAHEFAAHFVARPEVLEGRPGLVDQLLTSGLRRAERRADLRVAEAAELAHDDRATLSVRQRGEIGHERTKLLARLRVVADSRRSRCVGRRLPGASSNDRDRLVVGDPEEPRLDAPSIGRARSDESAASMELCRASRASASCRRSERQ